MAEPPKEPIVRRKNAFLPIVWTAIFFAFLSDFKVAPLEIRFVASAVNLFCLARLRHAATGWGQLWLLPIYAALILMGAAMWLSPSAIK